MLYVFFLKQLYFYKQYPQWADSSTQFSSFDPYDHERQAELQARKIRLTGGKNKCLALGLLTSVWLCWDLTWIFYIMVELPARPCMGGKEQGQAKRTRNIVTVDQTHSRLRLCVHRYACHFYLPPPTCSSLPWPPHPAFQLLDHLTKWETFPLMAILGSVCLRESPYWRNAALASFLCLLWIM